MRINAAEIDRILRFVERPELASQLGLGRDVLEDPEATVPVGLWYDFIEAATDASGDPFLGLHFGCNYHRKFRASAGAIAFLVQSSDTVRIAFDRMARYQSYWNDAERYETEETDRDFVMRYAPWGPARPAHVQVTEKTVAQTVLFLRQVAPGTTPLAVYLPHARRAGSEELTIHLGREPEFGRSMAALVFDRAVLDVKLPYANAARFKVLDRQLAERICDASPTSAIADRARKAISDYLHRERLSIDMVAKALHLGERTLQRQLAAERTTFRDLVDEVRKSRALALLDSGATVSELLVALGYAEEATLYRSFRRWTGGTPEDWRSRRERGST